MVVVMTGRRQAMWWWWALCEAIEQNAAIISFFAGQRGGRFQLGSQSLRLHRSHFGDNSHGILH
jgi:hypothetical protein